jgi:hypothetical protein
MTSADLPVIGFDMKPYLSFRRSLVELVGDLMGLEFALLFNERLAEFELRLGCGKEVKTARWADGSCIVVHPDDRVLGLQAALDAGDFDVVRRFVHGDS